MLTDPESVSKHTADAGCIVSVCANTQSDEPPNKAGRHMHTLVRSGSVSPLGPWIVPLRRPRVVVDEVHSAIVLTLLCRHKQNQAAQ